MAVKKQRAPGATTKQVNTLSTALILCGLAITPVVFSFDSAADIFAGAAVVVGVSLGIATGIETRAGIRNLIRVDILILWVFYGLTFYEFLFPQREVDSYLSPESAVSGTAAVLLGFAGLAVGRHLVPKSMQTFSFGHVRSTSILGLLALAAVVGYLHILISVSFDPFEMLRQMALPRFSQSWAREQQGGAYSLLYELGMLIYVIPPLGGIIFARSREYSTIQKLVVALILSLTFYYAFASGTRNVIGTFAVSFAGPYFLVHRSMSRGRILLVGGAMLGVLLLAMGLMLEFRKEGLDNFSFFGKRQYDTVFVDLNIINISKLIAVFPSQYEFLGFEIPYNALIRPIPRVFWPGKPEGLSISIERALGEMTPGMTLSCTFVGESYMAGGFFAVLIAGLLIGAAAGFWNRFGRDLNSPITVLLYASGFVCAAVAMRSILSVVPLMLPTGALWLYIRYVMPRILGPYRSPRTSGRTTS